MKTRIARQLGDARALAVHRELAERTVATARRVGDANLTIAFTPADATDEMRAWLGDDLAYEAQRGGDLGARMANAIERRLRGGATHVLVIGTDAPELSRTILADAFSALDRTDVVIGPASDGGYYLIGMRALHRELFVGVPWSTPETLARTLAAARTAGHRVHVLDILSDVDTADDWRAWMRRIGRPVPD